MRIVTLALLASPAAFGSTQTSMPYAPTVSVQPTAEAARPLVAVDDRVVNERRAGREDPTWIGTIRGGYGNPLKRLNSDAAFADGLVARGLRSPAGNSASPYRLAVTIHHFDANQYVRREATADFSAVLTDGATGREVRRDRHRAYNVDGSLLSLSVGVFASTEDLRHVALLTMSQAVDALLDKPGSRAALRRG